MEIQVTTDNYKILGKTINDLMGLLRELALEYKDNKIKEKYRQGLLDIALRIFPNAKAIDTLLYEYFINNFTGLNLPIGLIMRCCLEDILFGSYLLTFKKHITMLDTELDVKSLQFFKSFIHYYKDFEPEYFLCDKEKIEEIKLANNEFIEKLKEKYPVFYDGNKLAYIKNIRRRNQFQGIYFNRDTRNKANDKTMNLAVSELYQKVKEQDFSFSYIYFVYKYYCLYEHYTFHARNVIELNPYSFGQLALGFEFICRGLQEIIPFVTENDKYNSRLIEIKSNLGKMITRN